MYGFIKINIQGFHWNIIIIKVIIYNQQTSNQKAIFIRLDVEQTI